MKEEAETVAALAAIGVEVGITVYGAREST